MRKIPLVQGEYYHLYNRGVDKRKIFTNSSEYRRFLAYVHLFNTAEPIDASNFFRTHSVEDAFALKLENPLVAIGAFCLMPNHFHLYITPLAEKGVSSFMQRLELAYTKYFNKKHDRTGSLFESTFKSEHVANENFAKYLFSYIHLNPAKLKDTNWKARNGHGWKELEVFVMNYPYSSYQEYASGQYGVISPEHFPGYLASRNDMHGHIRDWLQFRPIEGN